MLGKSIDAKIPSVGSAYYQVVLFHVGVSIPGLRGLKSCPMESPGLIPQLYQNRV